MAETKQRKETFEERQARKRQEAEAEARQLAQQAADEVAKKGREAKEEQPKETECAGCGEVFQSNILTEYRKKLYCPTCFEQKKAERKSSLTLAPVTTGFTKEDIVAIIQDVVKDVIAKEIARLTPSRTIVDTTLSDKTHVDLPTMSTILAWCKDHPTHDGAEKILKHGHSWTGPEQKLLDVLRDMQEGK
jgi:hypothetical protein